MEIPQDIQALVQIDELALDKECVRLPQDLLKAMYHSSEKKRGVDEAKATLEEVSARKMRAVREHPENYGIEKVTESAISAALQSSKAVREASAALIEAKFQSEQAQAIVWALEAKKKTLALLIDLHAMGYFSEPNLSKAGKEEVARMTRQAVRPRRPSEEE